MAVVQLLRRVSKFDSVVGEYSIKEFINLGCIVIFDVETFVLANL